ncbi:MAG: aminotransferase class IV [Geitlerinemataceae cyanobacterium]
MRSIVWQDDDRCAKLCENGQENSPSYSSPKSTINDRLFWYNGNLICGSTLTLEITDPGWLYGATVFTTLRVYGNASYHPLTHWIDHHNRLQTSIAAFGWQDPDWQRLHQGAVTLIPHYPILRITLFPDGRELITGRFLPPDLEQRQQQGITAGIADAPQFQRWLPTHKTGNYLGAWLALQAARTQRAGEAILVDECGNWLETSTGNLWGWREGCWWTPPEKGILPGIGRSHAIECLRTQNQTVIEQPWTKEFAQTLETLAYTNSVVELVPIHTVIQLPREHQPKETNPAMVSRYNPHHPSLTILRNLLRG